jgi:hypothetical protein
MFHTLFNGVRNTLTLGNLLGTGGIFGLNIDLRRDLGDLIDITGTSQRSNGLNVGGSDQYSLRGRLGLRAGMHFALSDGITLLELQCRLQKIVPATPVIMMTGRDEPGLSNVALSQGAAAFLSKPFTDETFLTAISQHRSKIPGDF